jgi:NAD(P)-dependent dehydrogenase (short-subunit alcohol dehydrogenase family)
VIVIVTGGGGAGCGRAIAQRFARDGATVVVADINDAGGRETVDVVTRVGGRAVFHHADVSDREQARELIGFSERSFGRLDVLVNNASALLHPGDPLDHWDETIGVDFLGAMYCTRHAIDAMRRAGAGAIVNIASISSLWHGRRFALLSAPAYDSAKAALIRLTTTLMPLAASDGIRVNCLAPGWIATDGPRQYWESLTPEQRIANGVPSKLLEPARVADAVVHLATDTTLAGRVLVWWSEDEPRLIEWGDRGYQNWSPAVTQREAR